MLKHKYSGLRRNQQGKLEAVNTGFAYTASSGLGYCYPWDRNEFADTPLGMEQKAAYFIMVMQIFLANLIRTA